MRSDKVIKRFKGQQKREKLNILKIKALLKITFSNTTVIYLHQNYQNIALVF